MAAEDRGFTHLSEQESEAPAIVWFDEGLIDAWGALIDAAFAIKDLSPEQVECLMRHLDLMDQAIKKEIANKEQEAGEP